MNPTTESELIHLLSKKVEHIFKQIESDQFFSVITDTTQDINRKGQLSQIIRYVLISEDEAGSPTTLKISECFLGFT